MNVAENLFKMRGVIEAAKIIGINERNAYLMKWVKKREMFFRSRRVRIHTIHG